jgi:dolichol-phosphate mannosyltransferase
MNKDMLYVVLPCYNEEQNISNLIKDWKAEEEGLLKVGLLLKIIVVSDGSSDSTMQIARAIESTEDNVKVLDHVVNKGLGEAVNTGINYVVDQNTKGLMCIMDADMTHAPHYIHSMVRKLTKEALHCVIASRYRKGSKVEGLSSYRRLLSYGARMVYTMNLRIPGVRDYTCGYRLYKIDILKTLLEKYKGRIVEERGFACMIELLAKISKEGFKIGEVPFVLKYQLKGGQSKMKVWKTITRSLLVLAGL